MQFNLVSVQFTHDLCAVNMAAYMQTKNIEAKSLKLKPRAKSQLIKVRGQEPKARSQTQSETKGINKTRF
jgi:hypothetical protein